MLLTRRAGQSVGPLLRRNCSNDFYTKGKEGKRGRGGRERERRGGGGGRKKRRARETRKEYRKDENISNTVPPF